MQQQHNTGRTVFPSRRFQRTGDEDKLDLYFSLHFTTDERSRQTLDLEAETTEQRDRYVRFFRFLVHRGERA